VRGPEGGGEGGLGRRLGWVEERERQGWIRLERGTREGGEGETRREKKSETKKQKRTDISFEVALPESDLPTSFLLISLKFPSLVAHADLRIQTNQNERDASVSLLPPSFLLPPLFFSQTQPQVYSHGIQHSPSPPTSTPPSAAGPASPPLDSASTIPSLGDSGPDRLLCRIQGETCWVGGREGCRSCLSKQGDHLGRR